MLKNPTIPNYMLAITGLRGRPRSLTGWDELEDAGPLRLPDLVSRITPEQERKTDVVAIHEVHSTDQFGQMSFTIPLGYCDTCVVARVSK